MFLYLLCLYTRVSLSQNTTSGEAVTVQSGGLVIQRKSTQLHSTAISWTSCQLPMHKVSLQEKGVTLKKKEIFL